MSQDLLASLSLGNMLGKGHFGEVYEAHDQALGKVAVKVFRKLPGESDTSWECRKENLLKEGQKLKEAEHKHIIRVFQVLDHADGNSIYLVMEYCDNGSLQSQFELGPMNLNQLRSIMQDVSLGLHAIHARNLIHRDIKPANILLDQNGRAKLGDFGLVTDEFILGYASAVGYLDHLAIETFNNYVTSIRTDVWAVGMTIYRLLHGQEFYEELPPPQTTVPHGGFAASLPWLPHIPKEWRRFVRHLMRDDPAQRCQDALKVIDGLGQLSTMPDWYCEYTGSRVIWRRTKKARRLEVVWIRHSSRHHEWAARSYPLGTGKEIRLAGSSGKASRSSVEQELRKYFEKSQKTH